MFGRWIETGRSTIPPGDDYSLFEPVAPLLRADLSVANLETPVLRALPQHKSFFNRLHFAATVDEARHLARAGITHVNLANNHSFDMFQDGVRETPENLRNLGIEPIGVSYLEPPVFRAETVSHGDWRIAFIGITSERNYRQKKNAPVLPWVEWDSEIAGVLVPVVEAARPDHDLVIVVAHWGWEYEEKPRSDAQAAARALIDAGADLVVGHHPHVLQPLERYQGGLIAYSLGNFRFDQRRLPTRMSGVLRVRFAGTGCLDAARFHPVEIKAHAVHGRHTHQPVPAAGKMADRIRARVSEGSAKLGATWTVDGEDLVLANPACPPAPAD
jgi:poly-gamma-glutamate synthesis protein (capsule biosynthesis protein)